MCTAGSSSRTTCTANSGKRQCWLGRTRTGAAPLRGRLLCPLSYEPSGSPGQIRTGVPQLCRLVPNHSVTGLRCPRLDSNQRSPPSEGGALLHCATRTCVAEPGVEPGMPRRLFYRQLSGPSLTSAVGCLTGVEPVLGRLTTACPNREAQGTSAQSGTRTPDPLRVEQPL